MLPVSICLTTYNRARVLAATLDSLLGQTFADFELIVSDDASSDETRDVIAEYQKRDPRVRFRRNSTNVGMPGNLNAAISEACGLYIANVHDGDIYRPDLIAHWKRALDDNPEAPFVFNAYECVLPTGQHRIDRVTEAETIVGTEIALHYFRTFSSCVWGAVMARRQAYRAAGPFDPAFAFISDVDMWLKLACGSIVAYVPEPLMTLSPREAEHPYYGYPWRSIFWGLEIYKRSLHNYFPYIPSEVQRYTKHLPLLVRKLWFRRLAQALKACRLDQVRHGLLLCADSPDPLLRWLGVVGGSGADRPAWYCPELWSPLVECQKRPHTTGAERP